MMERKKKYYSDIITAICLIEQFVSGTKNFADYSSSAKTKSAVERQLIIIGEAVNNLQKINPKELENAQKIVSFRNRMVHSYDSVEDSIVWLILNRHLPLLKSESEKKYKEL